MVNGLLNNGSVKLQGMVPDGTYFEIVSFVLFLTFIGITVQAQMNYGINGSFATLDRKNTMWGGF